MACASSPTRAKKRKILSDEDTSEFEDVSTSTRLEEKRTLFEGDISESEPDEEENVPLFFYIPSPRRRLKQRRTTKSPSRPCVIRTATGKHKRNPFIDVSAEESDADTDAEDSD